MAAYYSRIQAEHEVLAELQERWRMILAEIMEAQDLSRNQTLLDLLLVYNMVNRRETAVSEDGALYEKPLFEQSYFTERAGLADEYYHNVLVYRPCRISQGRRATGKSCGDVPIAKPFLSQGSRRTHCRLKVKGKR